MPKKIRICEAEVGKYYFRMMPGGSLEAVKLVSISQFCGAIENAFGAKVMVPLQGELYLEEESPEVPKVEQPIQSTPYIRTTSSRTGIIFAIDTLLTTAPPQGYSAKEMIKIIMQSGRSTLDAQRIRFVIHTRIWWLRKHRGFENVAPRRRYKLVPVPVWSSQEVVDGNPS